MAYVPGHRECFPHYVFASLFRMLQYFPNLTLVGVAQVGGFHRLSSLTMQSRARAVSFPVSDEHQHSPSSNLSLRSIPRRFFCFGVLLAVWHFFCLFCSFSLCFLDSCVQASLHVMSGRQSSIYPLASLKKLCT